MTRGDLRERHTAALKERRLAAGIAIGGLAIVLSVFLPAFTLLGQTSTVLDSPGSWLMDGVGIALILAAWLGYQLPPVRLAALSVAAVGALVILTMSAYWLWSIWGQVTTLQGFANELPAETGDLGPTSAVGLTSLGPALPVAVLGSALAAGTTLYWLRDTVRRLRLAVAI